MGATVRESDPYEQLTVAGYVLTRKVGAGKIGVVYRAEREDPAHVLACKVIEAGKLKQGWERELQKVVRLRTVPNVVQYHSHDTSLDKEQQPFVWVLCDYVDGRNLREYLAAPPVPIDLAFVLSIATTLLQVLHACKAVDIEHGDLHEGNILISNPDPRLPGNPRRIWVSDFGYGGSHNDLEPKDDYRQLFSIVSRLLQILDPAMLNPPDRVLHQRTHDFLRKRLLEIDATQGRYVGNPSALIDEFSAMRAEAEKESAAASKGEQRRGPGDYLWAEALGNRADEWRSLFVPEFPAAHELLSKNITVLTGARGCGKTMAFRRITAFMDAVIGEPSGVPGADQFVGFYINCRDLVEAFPWLPRRLSRGMQEQLIHYFHLSWLTEILKTLAIYRKEGPEHFAWLDGFFAASFPNAYSSLPNGADVLSHARAFVEGEKERCRLVDLGSKSGLAHWPLARMEFLDKFQEQLRSHVSWIAGRPIYLFVDDYTIPIITREAQRVLNPIIFKRRSDLFFKVSTEAANSFERTCLRGKPLELHQDFELIDLATESLHQGSKSRVGFLEKVFRPRIDRHPCFNHRELGLRDVLGRTKMSNNQLAKTMREAARSKGKKAVHYQGVRAFAGMWSSDIRIMIQMFTDMLREASEDIKRGVCPVKPRIQDRVYRAAGGEFLVFAESAQDPALWEKRVAPTRPDEPYGRHLRDIVEAFMKVSRYELTWGKLVLNQSRRSPKQAFRLEIIDKFDLTSRAVSYCEGLIRWHLFLQDWRGKSIRGMITPRLYLNRVLIPYCNLTFSKHDNIHLTNQEFIQLLTRPKEFPSYWGRKRGDDQPLLNGG